MFVENNGLTQCYSAGAQQNLRVPQVAASGLAKTVNSPRTKCSTTVLCAGGNLESWIIAYGFMSSTNICRRFRCSKKIEKHRVNL